jgi:peptidylprolyl isomerase
MSRTPAFLARAAAALAFVLAACGTAPAAAQDRPEIATAEAVVNEVYGDDVLARVREGQRLRLRQRVATGSDSAARIRFDDGTVLSVGAQSEVVLDEFVYRPQENAADGVVRLTRGVLRLGSGRARLGMEVRTPAATLGIRGTVFDVRAVGGETEVAVFEGRVEVTGPFGTRTVEPGQVLRVRADGRQAERPQGPSAELQRAVAALFRILSLTRPALAGEADDYAGRLAAAAPVAGRPPAAPPAAQQAPTPAGQPAAIARTRPPPAVLQPDQERAYRAAIAGRDARELLVIDLPHGRVVIEMRPDLAPVHVARIKELVREGFYDGLPWHLVRPGFTAETGDPTGTGQGGSGRALPLEPSDEAFVRGSVGMTRDARRRDGADSQFFVTLDDQNHLNASYTYWGRVIHGLEHLEALPAGTPPPQPGRIVRAFIAADPR